MLGSHDQAFAREPTAARDGCMWVWRKTSVFQCVTKLPRTGFECSCATLLVCNESNQLRTTPTIYHIFERTGGWTDAKYPFIQNTYELPLAETSCWNNLLFIIYSPNYFMVLLFEKQTRPAANKSIRLLLSILLLLMITLWIAGCHWLW